jgi:hypothetical protein
MLIQSKFDQISARKDLSSRQAGKSLEIGNSADDGGAGKLGAMHVSSPFYLNSKDNRRDDPRRLDDGFFFPSRGRPFLCIRWDTRHTSLAWKLP